MPPSAVPTETVLLDEFRRIWPEAPAPTDAAACGKAAFERGQAALCLSGGGIRSASFALGVLQGLSERGLLTGFHYLSTVSGGGYIGSWLQRWIAESDAESVMAALGARTEPPQVKALRENSNFITPRVGVGSNDTWTAIALSLRNILINGMLFAPVFLLAGLVPNLVAATIRATPETWVAHCLLGIGVLCLALGMMWTCRALPSYREPGDPPARSADKWVNLRIVLPLAVWGTLGTIALSPLILEKADGAPSLQGLAVANIVGTGAGMLMALAAGGRHRRRAFAGDLPLWCVAILASTAVLITWTEVAAHMTETAGIAARGAEMLTIMSPLLALAPQLAATTIFVAFRTLGPNRGIMPDADREWLARLSALKLKPVLLWALAGFAALGVNDWVDRLLSGSTFDLSITGIGAAISGLVAVLGGRSSRSAGPVPAAGLSVLRRLPLNALVALTTVIFALALLTVHAQVEQRIAGGLAARLPGWPRDILNAEVMAHIAIAIGLAATVAFLTRRIPVNRFSLNGLYRNRLSRAFLGAARGSRKPDPFTGFDPQDNVRMHSLRGDWAGQPLYPVVNVALNVTAGDNLAWQERKAAPFVFTPLYSGSGSLMREDAGDGRCGAYLPSDCYGGNEADLALDGTGVTLATAMAISGAAASPNRGYSSSPATAFLMTLFNVRLGAWLPNPARAETLGERVTASGPSNNLRAILRELAGATQDTGRDIYLSDGGHFDNLALYEMLRRRCRYIVVSDAGCDPDLSFADLGAAVRKAAIDQDVKIDFAERRWSRGGRDIDRQVAYALGTIAYPDIAERGRILYIKPSFFGTMPVDVRSYAEANPSFPHETTVDQFFSESQFESYRALGRYFTSRLSEGATAGIAGLFASLEPPPPAVRGFPPARPGWRTPATSKADRFAPA